MKRIIITFLCLLVFLSACEEQKKKSSDNGHIFRQSVFLMDTLVEIQVVAEDGVNVQQAVSAALSRMQDIEKKMSRFLSDSEVSQINKEAGHKPVKVSKELIDLLKRAKEWGRFTEASFDVTIGAISRIWDFEAQKIPNKKTVSELLPLVNFNQLELDEIASTGYLPLKGMAVESGGIAKGYAVDEAVRVLEEAGIKRALVNAGGDMRALGCKPNGQPWKIGVQHPREVKEIIAIIPLRDKAVVTSGDYERYFIKDGVRYHHILDPHTGQSTHGLISVTVIAPLAETADVLATAIFVAGEEKGIELVRNRSDCEALLITSEGQIITTPDFPVQLKVRKIDLKSGFVNHG